MIIFCGPCVIESRDSCLWHAEELKSIFENLPFQFVFKSSFDKANRTSLNSFRGPGLEEGLQILAKVKESLSLPVVSDIHEVAQVPAASEVLDVLQIPAFLSRQTDLLVAAAKTARPLLVKKGQFMAPGDMEYVAAKISETNSSSQIFLCERGNSFGYRHLIVDFAGVVELKKLGYPIIFDATHSVQVIGGNKGSSSGRREAVTSLIRAAVAIGVDGLFVEVHKDPKSALSDGANMLSIEELKSVLHDVLAIDGLELLTKEKSSATALRLN